MSLDVYLSMPNPEPRGGSGIFVRRNGSMVEIEREEWDRLNPERAPVVLMDEEDETDEVFSANVTHNLNKMADAAGIYEALWHPAELDPDRAARIKAQQDAGNYHNAGGVYEIEREATIYARDLIEPLTAGLALLRADPAKFEALNPDNGWGSYAHFVPWVERYLAACREYPDAEVRVSR